MVKSLASGIAKSDIIEKLSGLTMTSEIRKANTVIPSDFRSRLRMAPCARFVASFPADLSSMAVSFKEVSGLK